jgi:CheY-like chemotaxis protein
VLVVDDEESFLLSFADGLRTCADGIEVVTAGNGKEAVAVLEQTGVDLVLTDLKMPEMDGFELIAYLSRRHRGLPVIVMTAYASVQVRDQLQQVGSVRLLEKPLDLDEAAELILETLRSRSMGRLHGIAVTGFLQLLEAERTTCTVRVRAGDRTGRVYLEAGHVVDAETGGIDGMDAALEIVTWQDVEIELEPGCPPRAQRIETPLATIILEGMRLVDERAREVGDDPTASPGGTPAPGATVEGKMDIQKIKQAIENLKDQLGSALVATDIITVADGQTIGGHNTQPRAAALFNQLTQYLQRALSGSGFPALGRYYLIDLEDDKLIVILPLGEYLWGILTDSSEVQLGLLLNVVIPDSLKAFEEAMG